METTTRIRAAIDAIKVSLDDSNQIELPLESPADTLSKLTREIESLKAQKASLIREIQALKSEKETLSKSSPQNPVKTTSRNKKTVSPQKSKPLEMPSDAAASMRKLMDAFEGF